MVADLDVDVKPVAKEVVEELLWEGPALVLGAYSPTGGGVGNAHFEALTLAGQNWFEEDA